MATEDSEAIEDTTTLLRKYRARGIVCHMSEKGCSVRCVGNQVKSPCTSASGFSADLPITKIGGGVTTPSTRRPTRRVHRTQVGSRIGGPPAEPVDHQQVQPG